MSTRLVKLPTKEERAPYSAALLPLLQGRPVTLTVTDSKMRIKGRVSTPILLIAPLSLYNSDSTGLLMSLPGYGCEVVYPPKVTSTDLYRLGLSMNAAMLLTAHLNLLFKQQPRS